MSPDHMYHLTWILGFLSSSSFTSALVSSHHLLTRLLRELFLWPPAQNPQVLAQGAGPAPTAARLWAAAAMPPPLRPSGLRKQLACTRSLRASGLQPPTTQRTPTRPRDVGETSFCPLQPSPALPQPISPTKSPLSNRAGTLRKASKQPPAHECMRGARVGSVGGWVVHCCVGGEEVCGVPVCVDSIDYFSTDIDFSVPALRPPVYQHLQMC